KTETSRSEKPDREESAVECGRPSDVPGSDVLAVVVGIVANSNNRRTIRLDVLDQSVPRIHDPNTNPTTLELEAIDHHILDVDVRAGAAIRGRCIADAESIA